MLLTTNTITANNDYEFKTNFKIGTIFIAGNFDGASIQFSQSFDGVTFVPVTTTVWTSNTITNFLSAAPWGRLTVSGGGAGLNLQVHINGIYYGA